MSTPGVARPEAIDDVPDTARRDSADAVANVSREELHFRRIDMRGYRRSDGLYIETFTDAAPYAMCPEGGRALQGLKGLRIVSGWSKVRSRMSGDRSCSHLMELLIPLGTVTLQPLSFPYKTCPERIDKTGRPTRIDSCYAYGAERELVARIWPKFHRPKRNED